MKIKSQLTMVLNLDKCIGCHTCSVTCKNIWTSRKGIEYAWFNNVETKPGVGYPNSWEDQTKWNGGWIIDNDGNLIPKLGDKFSIIFKLFANPDLPIIYDYYEPYTFNYSELQSIRKYETPVSSRPVSVITGNFLKKINSGPNWEEILGGEYAKRSKDVNFAGVDKYVYGKFKNTFMIYLPRLCEHCLNPACVSVCPSGAIYKRLEDGIVLIDQNKCRGWRMCISACPYKKIYFNWYVGKSEKCIFCYPRIESGMTTVCSETCVGRIRYVGVMLYDMDKISLASLSDNNNLYLSQLKIFLDPNDKNIIKLAINQGISRNWIISAINSPVYKMIIDWKIALPLHPEYRTLPMVWYIPPLSPIQTMVDNHMIPNVQELRIPIKYLSNLFTAGNVNFVSRSLKRLIFMRMYMRSKLLDNKINVLLLEKIDLNKQDIEKMYDYLSISNYENRFVIPSCDNTFISDSFTIRSGLGFDVENIDIGINNKNLFGGV